MRFQQGVLDKEIRSGVDFISKTAPGRYATADAIADEDKTNTITDLIKEGGFYGWPYSYIGNNVDPRQHITGTDHFRKMSQELRVATPSESTKRFMSATSSPSAARCRRRSWRRYTGPGLL